MSVALIAGLMFSPSAHSDNNTASKKGDAKCTVKCYSKYRPAAKSLRKGDNTCWKQCWDNYSKSGHKARYSANQKGWKTCWNKYSKKQMSKNKCAKVCWHKFSAIQRS